MPMVETGDGPFGGHVAHVLRQVGFKCRPSGIRRVVAEIEASGMTSLAEPSVSPSRLRHMLRVDWDHHNVGFVNQRIEFASTRLAFACLDDECRLEQCGR
jgi:hypothetical protein